MNAPAPHAAAEAAVEVAVLFDQFGPYHHARLRSAARRMSVLAVELCGQSLEYAWEAVATGADFRRATLFPGRDRSGVAPEECRRRVFAAFDEHRPAAVAVPGWGTPAALAALDWCARRGRPAVVMSESTAWDEPRAGWKEAVKRRVVGGHGAAGLVGGRPQADYLASLGVPAERIFPGYDVVDNGYFAREGDRARAEGETLRARLGLPERYFLASCRFVEKKNLPRLLRAYALYRAQARAGAADRPWPLVLLGDGPLRPALLQLREELGLREHVSLPGFVQYGQLPAYYGLAGAFVHASTAEQWGLVVNEAMAAGLPVLVSDRCGCAPDLVADADNGWTFDPADAPALAAAMGRVAALPEPARAAMGRRGRGRIEAGWPADAFGEGLRRAVAAARAAPLPRPGLLGRALLRALLLKR